MTNEFYHIYCKTTGRPVVFHRDPESYQWMMVPGDEPQNFILACAINQCTRVLPRITDRLIGIRKPDGDGGFEFFTTLGRHIL